MRKTAVSITAAMFAMTALSSPARADGDMVRLGVGLGALIIGEIAKGAGKGGNKRQPEGRADRRQTTTSGNRNRSTTRNAKTATGAATAAAIAVSLPEVGPTPLGKPTTEEMAAWVADAPNREQADIEAATALEMAEVIDPATTAATTDEAATVDMVDEQGRNWGKLTPSEAKKVWDMVGLGMTASQAFAAFPALKEPVAETAERETYDLIDDEGQLWGEVSKETADKIWKAVDLGMTRRQAFEALSGLPNPYDVKATTPTPEVAEAAPPVVDEMDQPAAVEPVEAVDTKATTAAVEPTPEVVEQKPAAVEPVAKAKPKLDIDL